VALASLRLAGRARRPSPRVRCSVRTVKQKVRSSMRGSPELLTSDLGQCYSKSASPIAFADIRPFFTCMPNSNPFAEADPHRSTNTTSAAAYT